jgi:FkbM family methyltransferase
MSLRRLLREIPFARRIYAETFVFRYVKEKVFLHPTSFAQAGEDLKVQELIGNVSYFIDIGAHDGISGSNTFYFALRGARGACFEPVKETFSRLASLYRLNSKIICRNCAISDVNRHAEIMAADFHSYIPDTEDQRHTDLSRSGFLVPPRSEQISLLTFDTAISELDPPREIDLLSIDVEDHELKVLTSIPFEKFSFRVIVVETHLFDVQKNELKWQHRDIDQINDLLRQSGYHLVAQSWVNSLYMQTDTPFRN